MMMMMMMMMSNIGDGMGSDSGWRAKPKQHSVTIASSLQSLAVAQPLWWLRLHSCNEFLDIGMDVGCQNIPHGCHYSFFTCTLRATTSAFRFDSIHLTNRFESIRFPKKIGPFDSTTTESVCNILYGHWSFQVSASVSFILLSVYQSTLLYPTAFAVAQLSLV